MYLPNPKSYKTLIVGKYNTETVMCRLCHQDAMEQRSQQTSEAVGRVPEELTAALPAALSAALQKASQAGLLPSADRAKGQAALQVSSLSNESEQQLRLLVSEETSSLARAAQQMSSAQVSSSCVCILMTPAKQGLSSIYVHDLKMTMAAWD